MLPKTTTRAPALWAHQADQLRTYFEHHSETPDVALELPTGSGKTLVALLIAEWRRRGLGNRTVYACPTQQLAEQVHAAAKDQGLETVLLVGNHKTWDESDKFRYTSGKATAVTVYSHIFNAYSKFPDAQAVVFDDAHAAENYVADSWSVSIASTKERYLQIFEELKDDLDELFVLQMTDDSPISSAEEEVRLIPPLTIKKHESKLSKLLSEITDEDLRWGLQRISQNLSSCLFYVSRTSWYIRPMIPPTFEHPPFTEPEQRIYISATLGEGGELERAFGRSRIERISVPDAWEEVGSGRRFFVFPSLVNLDEDTDAEVTEPGKLRKELFSLSDKQLIISQSDEVTEGIATALDLPADELFRVKKNEFESFRTAEKGALLAANRYDGMDLAGDTCRLMLLRGLPVTSHLQDKFFESKLRARNVLQERVRTRVVQGLGRCTRGPDDYSVIIVEDSDLVLFLSREENIKAMPRELQAELRFGQHTSSQVTPSNLLALTRSALKQDELWAEQAEEEIIDWREDAEVELEEASTTLAKSSRREVKAWQKVWTQDWREAGQLAVEVHDNLKDASLGPYRSLWAYLAYCWLSLADEEGEQTGDKAYEYLEIAHKSSYGTTWLKELERTETSAPTLEDWEKPAIASIHTLVLQCRTKLLTKLTEMIADLGETKANLFERGLTTLGMHLGMRAYKPKGEARPDSAWLLPKLWITLEAKSDQKNQGTIAARYIRQANSHLNVLAEQEGQEDCPEGSFSVVISPRKSVDPDAVPSANRNLYLASPEEIMSLGRDTKRALSEIESVVTDGDEPGQTDQMLRILWNYKLLPSQVVNRLTSEPIR